MTNAIDKRGHSCEKLSLLRFSEAKLKGEAVREPGRDAAASRGAAFPLVVVSGSAGDSRPRGGVKDSGV